MSNVSYYRKPNEQPLRPLRYRSETGRIASGYTPQCTLPDFPTIRRSADSVQLQTRFASYTESTTRSHARMRSVRGIRAAVLTPSLHYVGITSAVMIIS